MLFNFEQSEILLFGKGVTSLNVRPYCAMGKNGRVL